MTSLWLFVTPCSTQLLCLLSSAASWSLEPTHGVECGPWQSHVLFWSCPSRVLTSYITLAVSILQSALLLALTLQSDDMFYHFYSQWGVSPPDYSRLLCFHNCHIIKMPSAGGLRKAFSTCASHLTAVTIFYGTLSYMYVHHSTIESQEQEKMASIFYGIVIPMLNPIIYSLRNQDVREALKGIGKKCS